MFNNPLDGSTGSARLRYTLVDLKQQSRELVGSEVGFVDLLLLPLDHFARYSRHPSALP